MCADSCMFTEKEEEQERGVEQVRDREETPTIKIPRSALLFLARTTYSAERERGRKRCTTIQLRETIICFVCVFLTET